MANYLCYCTHVTMYQLVIITILISSSISFSPTSDINQADSSISYFKKSINILNRSAEPVLLITQDPRFSLIQNSASESNLFIKNVRGNDAGEYACQLNTETLKAKFVSLIVLSKF